MSFFSVNSVAKTFPCVSASMWSVRVDAPYDNFNSCSPKCVLRRAADEEIPVATVARPWAFECSHRLATVATGKLFPAARLKQIQHGNSASELFNV
jgi:hypothetical protein